MLLKRPYNIWFYLLPEQFKLSKHSTFTIGFCLLLNVTKPEGAVIHQKVASGLILRRNGMLF